MHAASAVLVSAPFPAERGQQITLAISKLAQVTGAYSLAITICGRAQFTDQRCTSRSGWELALPLFVCAKLVDYFGEDAKLEGKHTLRIPHEFRQSEK